MKVLIINGAPGAGKTTFTKRLGMLTKGRVYNYSSIDWVKEIADIMGWDGEKDERGRQFLFDIKAAAISYDDIPLNKVTQQIHKCRVSGKYDYICVDIREPEEIRKLKRRCRETIHLDCYTILIQNSKAEEKLKASDINNPADNHTQDIPYDLIIPNNRSHTLFKREIIATHKLMQDSAVQLKDIELFASANDILDSDKPAFNSDQYQDVINTHYSELPVPQLSPEATMLVINALALCGEAGEIANFVKKLVWYRDGNMTEDDVLHLKDEIGDNLYHAAQLATIVKAKLSDIMTQSAMKCIERGKQGFEKAVEEYFDAPAKCVACAGRGYFAAPDDIHEKCKYCNGSGIAQF